MEDPLLQHRDDSSRVGRRPKYSCEKENGLFGVIFMCNKQTMRDCLLYGVFGLPFSRRSVVEQVVPGMVLFLFEYEDRQLHGIYEASSFGGIDIEPDAFKSSGSSFPCQVRCKILKRCAPLHEFEFQEAIKDNYFSDFKFKFNLTKKQVFNLMDLFLERIEGTDVSSFHRIHEFSECFQGAKGHFLHENKHFTQISEEELDEITKGKRVSSETRALCRDLLTKSKFILTSGYDNECLLPLNDVKCLSGCKNQGECLVANLVPPCCVPADPGTIIGQIDNTSVHNKGYAECEQSSSSAIASSEEKAGKNLSLEVMPALTSHRHLYSDRMNEKPSVWSRISGYKAPRKDHISKNESALVLAKRKRIELAKEELTDLTFAVDVTAEDTGTADSFCGVEGYLFNFRRKKTSASLCNLKIEHGTNQNKRRKLVRPDFTVSVESGFQSGQKPVATEERALPQEAAADKCVHNFNNDHLQIQTSVEMRHFNFDLNQPSTGLNMEDTFFFTPASLNAAEMNLFEQRDSREDATLLNCLNIETGSAEEHLKVEWLSCSLTIGMNSELIPKAAEGSSLSEQHDILKKEHMKAVEVDLDDGLSLSLPIIGKEGLTSLSTEVSAVSEQNDIPKKEHLNATESKGPTCQKGDSREDCPLLNLLNKEASPLKQEALAIADSLSVFGQEYLSKQEHFNAADINSDATCEQDTAGEYSTQMNLLNIEVPHGEETRTAEGLAVSPQEYVSKEEHPDAANLNLNTTCEQGISGEPSAQMNFLNSGASIEEESKGTAGELSRSAVCLHKDLSHEENSDTTCKQEVHREDSAQLIPLNIGAGLLKQEDQKTAGGSLVLFQFV